MDNVSDITNYNKTHRRVQVQVVVGNLYTLFTCIYRRNTWVPYIAIRWSCTLQTSQYIYRSTKKLPL